MQPWHDLKRFWGRIVFRFAGRNISAKNTSRSQIFYDSIGWLYDWLYADLIHGYRQAIQYVVDHHIQPGDRVLDLGCGTGLLLSLADDKANLLVGVDISLGMLRRARHKLRKSNKAFWIAGDCRCLPLQQKFDRIVSSFMLVILTQDDCQKLIQTLCDHLDEHGSLVILNARDELSSEWLSTEQWRHLCGRAGFSQVEFHDILDFYRIVIAHR